MNDQDKFDTLFERLVVAVESIASTMQEQGRSAKPKGEAKGVSGVSVRIVPADAYSSARKLAETLELHGVQVKNQGRAVKAWALDFEKLNRVDGIGYDQIKIGLEFNSGHFGEQYHPVIRSGKSFREKWDKLQAAMRRNQTFNFDKE